VTTPTPALQQARAELAREPAGAPTHAEITRLRSLLHAVTVEASGAAAERDAIRARITQVQAELDTTRARLTAALERIVKRP
jgi:hypothetical protein